MSEDGFMVKFSGEKVQLSSGVTRESKEGLPRFELLVPDNVPYQHTMVYRDSMLLSRGAENHGARNADQAYTEEDLASFLESAGRHYYKWLSGLQDEDHAAMLRWNVKQFEETKWRMRHGFWSPDD